MSRASFVLLIIGMLMIEVLSSAITVQKCGKNEEITTCGSACPPSCNSPNPPCIKKCIAGCQCKQGYLRNSSEQCVLPAECEKLTSAKGAPVNKTVTKGLKKI